MKMNTSTLNSGLLSLFLFYPLVSYSADFQLTIREKGTGIPVSGATVVLMESDNYDTSSSLGVVKFSAVDLPERIKVIATGYETETFSGKKLTNKKEKNQQTIYIEPIAVDGSVIEVVADRLVEKIAKISLTTRELTDAAGGAGDPLKTIAALPGTAQTEEDAASVYMRGSNGNENVTWVNQSPIGYLYHFGGSLSTIHPSLIADTSIFLGGFPVRYGDALGGVLDVKLRTPRNDRPRYELEISTITTSFLIEGPVNLPGSKKNETDRDSFSISGRRSYFDLILSPEDINDIIGDDNPDKILVVPNFSDFQVLYHHKLNNGYVDSFLFTAADELEIDLGGSTKNDPYLIGAKQNKNEFKTTGITWQQRWSKKWDSLTSLTYMTKTNTVVGGFDSPLNNAQPKPLFSNIEENTLRFQPEFIWRARTGSQTQFGMSASYTSTPIDLYAPRSFTNKNPDFDFSFQQNTQLKTEVKSAEFSPYVSHRQQWTKQLAIQLGLRYTNIGVTGGFRAHQFSPRLSTEYRILEKTLLLASWGRYIQSPDKLEIVESFGNPSLLMAEAEHRIIGVEHKVSSLYSVKAEIYQKPMKNLIIALDENPSSTNAKRFSNQGSGEAYGFDLFIKRVQRGGKYGWASLSWARSERTNEITGITRNFSGDQPLTLTTVWGQRFLGSWKHWNMNIKTQIRSGQPYTAVTGRRLQEPNDPDSAWVAEYGKQNAERLPVYYKIDLRIGREILLNRSKLTIFADFQNVTFRKNVVAFRYGDNFENINDPIAVNGYPFFSYFGINWEF